MSRATDSPSISLEASAAERWVIHHVMIEELDRVTPLPGVISPSGAAEPEHTIVAKLEADVREFTPLELDHIRHRCTRYARAADTPPWDRELVRVVVGRIDDLLRGRDW